MATWHYEPTGRATKAQMGALEQRLCPIECGGYVQRVAERVNTYPYRWVPIGWRCNRCGNVFIDTQVSV